MLDRELERLRHVVGVDVVQELGAKARNNDLLAGGEGVPDLWVKISKWSDRRPARAADVARLEHRGDQAAGSGLGGQQLGNGSLPGAVLAERRWGASSRIGCLTLGPYRQMVSQWTRCPPCPRSAAVSAAAESGVKQIMSTTTSASSAATRCPNAPAASSAARST